MKYILFILYRQRKSILKGVLFSAYVYVMFNIYLEYKLLDPVLHASLTKNRPYLIDTEGYKLPDFDPFHISIKSFLETPPEIDCSDGKRPLTIGVSNYKNLNGLSSQASSVIIIQEDHFRDYGVNKELGANLREVGANNEHLSATDNEEPLRGNSVTNDVTKKGNYANEEFIREYLAINDDNAQKNYISDKYLRENMAKDKHIMKKRNEEDVRYYKIPFSCCFQSIRRDSSKDQNFEEHLHDPKYDYPDSKFFIEKKCHQMKNKITPINEEAVLVQCSYNSEVFYRNIHLFVPVRWSKEEQKLPTPQDQLSIMIVGIDSVSRMNMQRYMPKTFNYLKEIKAIDLKGFNKNFENTYPNLLAMLSGWYERGSRFVDEFKKSDRYFDSVPFLWKNFSALGYKTLYGEDCSYLGTFAYKDKQGFRILPTDYYFRPYIKAAEELLGSNKGVVWISACQLCGGTKLMLQHILDYAATTSKSFYNKAPYFSLFWSTSLTHDKLYHAGSADEPVLKFLKDMNEKGYWNNTMVFFMSDHGIRYGGVRETFLGKLEENLPFNYIIIPKWIEKKYPILYNNLIYNQNRLTTTLDLHETFKDILLQRYKDEHYLQKLHSTRKPWLSLFRKIPSTRTCLDADIPLNYCAGQVAVQIPETSLVRLAATSILSKLNKGLTKFPMCYQLLEFEIKRSFIIKFYENEVNSNYTYYEVQVISYPGEALLEAIVKIQLTDKNSYKSNIIGDISRINKYGNQSFCVNDIKYSKYCLCKGIKLNQ